MAAARPVDKARAAALKILREKIRTNHPIKTWKSSENRSSRQDLEEQ
jgi:hypothetical protein